MDFLKGIGIIIGIIGYIFVFNWVWYKVTDKWISEDGNDVGEVLAPLVFPFLIPVIILIVIAVITLLGRSF